MLEEDLVGENEKAECPKCGEEYNGRQGLKTHIQKKHERSRKLRDLYLGTGEIHQKIASQTPYGPDTVRRLVKIGKLPEETLWLIEEN